MANNITIDPNLYTKNKYHVRISNLPNLTGIDDSELDLTTFSNNIKSVSIPSLTQNLLYSYWQQSVHIHPNPQGARETNTLNVEWVLDSRFLNYSILNAWVQGSRYGEPVRNDLLKDNCIDRFDIYTMDNTKTVNALFSFRRVFIIGVGELQLQFGSSEITTFQSVFQYERLDWTLNPEFEEY